MNNPDERTAIDQFGNGDKYFGVCTLMVTMPGLPMLGHGQIEGFAEKYGMEFRRPLWDETPDRALIERHEREIFPLMRMRPLFAGVEHFLLYDYFNSAGLVNEDVFAYSNRLGDEQGLVVYNNRFGEARGWVRQSVAFAQRTGQGDEKVQVQRTLAEGLRLESGDDWYSIARDQVSGLEYIRSNRQLREEGLYVELGAYRRLVMTGFRQVQDNAYGQYGQLTAYLEGRGVPSIDEALREIRLQPIQRPYRELVRADLLRRLLDFSATGPGPGVNVDVELLSDVETRLRDFLEEARRLDGGETDLEPVVHGAEARLGALLGLLTQVRDGDADELTARSGEPGVTHGTDPARTSQNGTPTRGANGASGQHVSPARSEADEAASQAATALAASLLHDRPEERAALLVWALTRPLGELVDPVQPAEQSRALFDEWLLGSVAERSLAALGLDDGAAMVGVGLTRVLLAHERALMEAGGKGPRRVLESLLSDGDVRDFLGVNRYREVLWFSEERFDALVAGLLATAVVMAESATSMPSSGANLPELAETSQKAPPSASQEEAVPSNGLAVAYALARSLRDAESASNYQLERLLTLLPISPVA
jgi:hypothetical protein